MISQLSPASTVSETSTYQKLIGSLRSPRTPQQQDKDVIMASPKSGISPSPNKPVFSSDDFIPFSRKWFLFVVCLFNFIIIILFYNLLFINIFVIKIAY